VHFLWNLRRRLPDGIIDFFKIVFEAGTSGESPDGGSRPFAPLHSKNADDGEPGLKIPLLPPDHLETIETEVTRHLQTLNPGKSTARLHPGVSISLNEAARGIARLFPHKKSLAYIKGTGPHFEAIMSYFSMEGMQIQPLEHSVLNETGWIEKLNKDTLMLLHGEDDPITGEIFSGADFRKALSDKRIFSVSISQARHRYDPEWKIDPYAVRIFSAKRFSLCWLGERATKIEPLTLGPSDWNQEALAGWKEIFTMEKSKKEVILNFENKNHGGSKPLFAPDRLRVWDRALIYWDDMDGEAFISLFAEKLGIHLEPPGSEDRLETTSLCRWGGLKSFKWLRDRGYSEETLRGLVILSPELLNEDFSKKVEAIRAEILQLQNR
jgi:hypothetical protein